MLNSLQQYTNVHTARHSVYGPRPVNLHVLLTWYFLHIFLMYLCRLQENIEVSSGREMTLEEISEVINKNSNMDTHRQSYQKSIPESCHKKEKKQKQMDINFDCLSRNMLANQ